MMRLQDVYVNIIKTVDEVCKMDVGAGTVL